MAIENLVRAGKLPTGAPGQERYTTYFIIVKFPKYLVEDICVLYSSNSHIDLIVLQVTNKLTLL